MDIKTFVGPAMMLATIFALTWALPRIFKYYYEEKESKTENLLESHQAEYADKHGMLCSSFDEPKKGEVQFFGTVLKTDIKPGMTLSFQDNAPWTIKTIYLDRYNPDKTSSVASARTKDTAIVVETNGNFDKKILKEQLRSLGFVYLKS
jgi:hypothetical protein